MKKNRTHIKVLVATAMIAAVYAVLTLAIAPLSFGLVQVRFSEILMLLAFVDKKYAPGLILGCFLANCFSPFGILDVIFGTGCTAAAMFFVTRFAKTLFGASIWIVVCNAFIGVELYLFGNPLWVSMGLVALGEGISVTLCGTVLFRMVMKHPLWMEKLKISSQ